jgi:hypothetical protein
VDLSLGESFRGFEGKNLEKNAVKNAFFGAKKIYKNKCKNGDWGFGPKMGIGRISRPWATKISQSQISYLF